MVREGLSVAEQLVNCAYNVVLLTHVVFLPCGSASALFAYCLQSPGLQDFGRSGTVSLFHFYIGHDTATHVQATFLQVIKTSSTNMSPVCRTEVSRKWFTAVVFIFQCQRAFCAELSVLVLIISNGIKPLHHSVVMYLLFWTQSSRQKRQPGSCRAVTSWYLEAGSHRTEKGEKQVS